MHQQTHVGAIYSWHVFKLMCMSDSVVAKNQRGKQYGDFYGDLTVRNITSTRRKKKVCRIYIYILIMFKTLSLKCYTVFLHDNKFINFTIWEYITWGETPSNTWRQLWFDSSPYVFRNMMIMIISYVWICGFLAKQMRSNCGLMVSINIPYIYI